MPLKYRLSQTVETFSIDIDYYNERFRESIADHKSIGLQIMRDFGFDVNKFYDLEVVRTHSLFKKDHISAVNLIVRY